MAKPPRDWFKIAELVERWKIHEISINDIEQYLATGEIKPSVNLPLAVKMGTCNQEPDCDGHSISIVVEGHALRSGLFCLEGYANIKWNSLQSGMPSSDLKVSNVLLHDYDNNECYCFYDSYIVTKDEIVICSGEVTRFETMHKLNTDTTVSTQLISIASDKINPKREKTLLTIIAALLEFIAGESEVSGGKMKHPSFNNYSDLIIKLSELEERGLSQRNLEGIFAQAKEAKRRH